MQSDGKREKNWKHLYLRSVKLATAKQLGFEYPRVPEAQLGDSDGPGDSRLNVLFVCSRNQWRSPTAERIWRSHPNLSVRSGGTSPNAKHPVAESDVHWAEVIFTMEEKHKARLLASFARALEHKQIFVLDVPDEYKYMDPALIEELTISVSSHLGFE